MAITRLNHFAMGGSIDEIKDPVSDGLVPGNRTQVGAYIHNIIKPTWFCETHTICMKMSNDLTFEDIAALQRVIRNINGMYPGTHILVTVGKFAARDVAQKLADGVADLNFSLYVVVTGSDHAIDGPSYSDGGHVVSFAIAKLEDIEQPGIYTVLDNVVQRVMPTPPPPAPSLPPDAWAPSAT